MHIKGWKKADKHKLLAKTEHLTNMHVSGFKFLNLFAVFLILCVQPSLGEPTTATTQRIPDFLTQLYANITSGNAMFPPGVTAVHSLYLTVKNSSELFASFSGLSLSLTTTIATNLHLQLVPRPNVAINAQALCQLRIEDIKTSAVASINQIPCNRNSSRQIPVTRFVNNWLKQPSTNLGLRVKISTNMANIPDTDLPFVKLSDYLNAPYFIMYT